MLTKRIIPCLDIAKGRVVKGVKFLNLKDAGDPVEISKIYEKEKADELVFLDITASFEDRDIMLDTVRKVAENIFMPFTVGGGIRDLEDIRLLLKAGADKVSINTAAVKNPLVIKKSSLKFGSQCIVVAIDAKRETVPLFRRKSGLSSKWEVYTHGGRYRTGLDAIKWAKKVEELGAGEILLTSMDTDGTKKGYDIDLTKEVSSCVNIPVIASGGAGNLAHLYDVLVEGKADAVLAASIFHYRKYTINQAKKYLKCRGVPVRI